MPSESTINEPASQKSDPSAARSAAEAVAGPEHGDPLMIPNQSNPMDSVTKIGDLGLPGSPERRAWASRFGRLVAADLDVLSSLAESETGKPRWETVTAEVMPLVASCRWHARRAGRVLKDRRLAGRPWWLLGQQGLVRRVPLGRVGIIGTWNYPIQLLGIQILQAVVAGNR